MKTDKRGLLALSPILVLLGMFLLISLVSTDFYSVSIELPFMVAIVYGMFLLKDMSWAKRVQLLSRGLVGNGVLYMLCIFCLAGAFATSARNMGAIDATVALTLKYLPMDFIPAGIFIAACFISLSIGTSVGTIAALAPVVTGLADQMSVSMAWLMAIVVGGAFFGDNLSFISDTTIAATQTQGCKMNEKFKANFMLVLPAAIVTLLIYIFGNQSMGAIAPVENIDWIKILPYIVVLVLAICGVNVLYVLLLGILITDVVGLICGTLTVATVFSSIGDGLKSMHELNIITMAAAGLMTIIRTAGGFDYLISRISKRITSARGAELAIMKLTALTNVCTANNTIAILTTGFIAKDLSTKYGVMPRISASIMDTTSCFIQGILPYGAQLLMAAGLASISPVQIIPYLYYPMLIGLVVLISILVGNPRKKQTNN